MIGDFSILDVYQLYKLIPYWFVILFENLNGLLPLAGSFSFITNNELNSFTREGVRTDI